MIKNGNILKKVNLSLIIYKKKIKALAIEIFYFLKKN
jgi:hypothetical protein